MSTLKAEKILTYLGDPLNRCLKDENPYVRKTAALCVAKAFELKPELCVEWGFVEILRDLVGDGNPMVSLLEVLVYTLAHAINSGRCQRSHGSDGHSRGRFGHAAFPTRVA
jgi:vesicle coat complex subunit